ncbi:hypothetical protein IEQ34_022359 [Dendrobium chrysotoxum]|uniref:Uncharacterized protein n=1 Tax=Dendrobium chrysotoxum TaxID=161865 RepID=A0AAV7FK45_DENCH|nr:hypothetical protein IEQ34_022359 [Dendrobium chrysotoxum]
MEARLVDSATSVGSRLSVALVLVELDITKSYPDKVWLGHENLGYIQHVSMEIFPAFCASCKCIGHLSGECRPLQPAPPIASSVSPSSLIVDVCGVGDKMDNSISCDVINGAQSLCSEIGNVVICDNTITNDVDEVINIVSNMSKDLALNPAVVVAPKPDLALGRMLASELPDASFSSAVALLALDNQSPVLDGDTTPVGYNSGTVLNSTGDDVVPVVLVYESLNAINCCLNLMVSPSSGKDKEKLRDDSTEDLALNVVPEG